MPAERTACSYIGQAVDAHVPLSPVMLPSLAWGGGGLGAAAIPIKNLHAVQTISHRTYFCYIRLALTQPWCVLLEEEISSGLHPRC